MCYDTDNLCEMQETFETYRKSSGLGSEARVVAALERWGANRFEVPLPQFADLLKEQLMAPFFVFQVFCVGLWCLDDYWCVTPERLGSLVALLLSRDVAHFCTSRPPATAQAATSNGKGCPSSRCTNLLSWMCARTARYSYWACR